MKDSKLTELRTQIDQTDKQIVALLDKRAAIAMQIGAAKNNGVVYRPAREVEVLKNAANTSNGDMPKTSLSIIYKEIIAACRNLQSPLSVSYLGPEGTYCEEAARLHCGQSSHYKSATTIDATIELAEKGLVDIAVLPLENSTEGSVTRTLDLLQKTSLKICGEIVLPIHHQLLGKVTKKENITSVIAHPQALAQCRNWLANNLPKAVLITATSNGEAARQASISPNTAAIASTRAADIYDLQIVSKNIEDEPTNTTRFIVLGQNESAATGNDKTSLICTVPNKPGALQNALSILAVHNINMTKLESRPSRSGPWEYLFYIDIDGHQTDTNIKKALNALSEQTISVKITGSYPKGAQL